MNLKKIAQKLSEIKDVVGENGTLNEQDRAELKAFISEEATSLNDNKVVFMKPVAHNDNDPLTADQHFRLRLMEKTGTGSHSIH
ncbi:MAG: hypothetical protein AAF549_01930 [Pseudomonadota bacterium]